MKRIASAAAVQLIRIVESLDRQQRRLLNRRLNEIVIDAPVENISTLSEDRRRARIVAIVVRSVSNLDRREVIAGKRQLSRAISDGGKQVVHRVADTNVL
ncbi:MAG: hypothetical protein R3D70_21420 [Rhizobiaceae bacterium]